MFQIICQLNASIQSCLSQPYNVRFRKREREKVIFNNLIKHYRHNEVTCRNHHWHGFKIQEWIGGIQQLSSSLSNAFYKKTKCMMKENYDKINMIYLVCQLSKKLSVKNKIEKCDDTENKTQNPSRLHFMLRSVKSFSLISTSFCNHFAQHQTYILQSTFSFDATFRLLKTPFRLAGFINR